MRDVLQRFYMAGAFALVQFSSLASAQELTPADLCATINTSSGDYNSSIYMSHGRCRDSCVAQGKSFAWGVLQGKNCWCSHYTPADDTLAPGKCTTRCPGYTEQCGGDGVYGYIDLGPKPKGTKGSGDPSINDGDPNDAPTTVQTVTADGTVRTVTITPTAGVEEPNVTAGITTSKKSPSTGEIVGIVVGVALGIIILFAIGCYIKIRRNRNMQGGTFEVRNAISTGGVSAMREQKPYTTTQGVPADGFPAKRNSTLMPVDPRMDPDTTPAIYMRNKSHESVHTLHDDQDYSRRVHQPRVLRATNPDPDHDG